MVMVRTGVGVGHFPESNMDEWLMARQRKRGKDVLHRRNSRSKGRDCEIACPCWDCK